MSATSRPRHGTRARYLRGCRCDDCTRAHYRYMSRYRLDAIQGRRRRTPAEPVRAHVRALTDAGWLPSQIAQTAGISRRTVADLLDRAFRHVSTRGAHAILRIPVGPPPPRRDVDATGTVRRLRALAAIGWPISHLAPEVGIHRDPLGRIARGELRQVRALTADAVARVYRDLSGTPGPSPAARAHARRRGWPDPTWWEDWGGLDDPGAPETEPPTTRSQEAVAAARREEVFHLHSYGVPRKDIAARVGISEDYVRSILGGWRTPGQPRTTRAAAAR